MNIIYFIYNISNIIDNTSFSSAQSQFDGSVFCLATLWTKMQKYIVLQKFHSWNSQERIAELLTSSNHCHWIAKHKMHCSKLFLSLKKTVLEKYKKHSPSALVSSSTSLVFLKIPRCLHNWAIRSARLLFLQCILYTLYMIFLRYYR